MIERQRSHGRWITRERLAQFSQVKRDPDPRRAKDACETTPSAHFSIRNRATDPVDGTRSRRTGFRTHFGRRASTNGGHALAEKAKGLVAVTRVRRFVDLTTQLSDLNHFFPRRPRLIDH